MGRNQNHPGARINCQIDYGHRQPVDGIFVIQRPADGGKTIQFFLKNDHLIGQFRQGVEVDQFHPVPEHPESAAIHYIGPVPGRFTGIFLSNLISWSVSRLLLLLLENGRKMRKWMALHDRRKNAERNNLRRRRAGGSRVGA